MHYVFTMNVLLTLTVSVIFIIHRGLVHKNVPL